MVARAARGGRAGRLSYPGIDLHQCREALALAEHYADVYAAVGIHPNSSGDFDAGDAGSELRDLARHPKVVAYGEIGLDYYWDKVDARAAARGL